MASLTLSFLDLDGETIHGETKPTDKRQETHRNNRTLERGKTLHYLTTTTVSRSTTPQFSMLYAL